MSDPRRPSYPIARLDYELPPELIAQQPLAERRASRMLVVDARAGVTRKGAAQDGTIFSAEVLPDSRRDSRAGSLSDSLFARLPELLPQNCLIVLNDSAVIPARVIGQRASGGRVELLYLRFSGTPGGIEALVGSNARLAAGEAIALPEGWRAELLEGKSLGGSHVRVTDADGVPATQAAWLDYLARNGTVPLPPYIRQGDAQPDDAQRYQTVYAQAAGSSAAPTAGLHFDDAMLARLHADGHEIARVTLHVGLATFAPLRADDLAEHSMHSEPFSVPAATAAAYFAALESGRPVLAVGTTSLRVLHTLLAEREAGGAGAPARVLADERSESENRSAVPPSEASGGKVAGTGSRPTGLAASPSSTQFPVPSSQSPFTGSTDAFIYPGHGTRAADLLLTNFHLPRSTLLALVYSFGGEELLRRAYAHAIEERYRFFSYGDCMLIRRVL